MIERGRERERQREGWTRQGRAEQDRAQGMTAGPTERIDREHADRLMLGWALWADTPADRRADVHAGSRLTQQDRQERMGRDRDGDGDGHRGMDGDRGRGRPGQMGWIREQMCAFTEPPNRHFHLDLVAQALGLSSLATHIRTALATSALRWFCASAGSRSLSAQLLRSRSELQRSRLV